ncbi:hypothetical protein [Streptococcus pluranimalium]|uniref:hypothetical protein n=1 Tax=Streptococcus pluranimalium TaxID=82348 RepID=UPI004046F610
MFNNQKIYASVLLAFFFLGILGGRFRQETALNDPKKAYQVVAENQKNGEQVVFQVQRYDNKQLKIQLSTGEVFSSKLTTKRKNGAWVIELPKNGGKLALRPDILPWKRTRLGILTSETFKEIPGSDKVITVDGVSALTENDLTETEPLSDTTVRGKVQLNSNQIDQVVSDFGQWLSKSSYGENAILVRGAFNDTEMSNSGPVGILAFEADNQRIFAGLSGDDMAGFESIETDIKNFSKSLIDINQYGEDISDFKSKASFRLYHLKTDKSAYFNDAKEEQKKLQFSDYADFYHQQVDDKAESLQILLANNGKVYYTKDYQLSSSVSYIEAPKEMQRHYNKLLSEYSK